MEFTLKMPPFFNASLLFDRLIRTDSGTYAIAGQDGTLTYIPVSSELHLMILGYYYDSDIAVFDTADNYNNLGVNPPILASLGSGVAWVKLSPDNSLLFVAVYTNDDPDQGLYIYNTSDWSEVSSYGDIPIIHYPYYEMIAVSNSYVALAGDDGSPIPDIAVYNMSDFSLASDLIDTGSGLGVAVDISPDETLLAVGLTGGGPPSNRFRVFNTNDWSEVTIPSGSFTNTNATVNGITAMKFSPDGKYIATNVQYSDPSDNRQTYAASVFKVSDWSRTADIISTDFFQGFQRTIGRALQFAWSPDSQRLAVAMTASVAGVSYNMIDKHSSGAVIVNVNDWSWTPLLIGQTIVSSSSYYEQLGNTTGWASDGSVVAFANYNSTNAANFISFFETKSFTQITSPDANLFGDNTFSNIEFTKEFPIYFTIPDVSNDKLYSPNHGLSTGDGPLTIQASEYDIPVANGSDWVGLHPNVWKLSTTYSYSLSSIHGGVPNDGDTVTVGSITYTFKNTLSGANQVKIVNDVAPYTPRFKYLPIGYHMSGPNQVINLTNGDTLTIGTYNGIGTGNVTNDGTPVVYTFKTVPSGTYDIAIATSSPTAYAVQNASIVAAINIGLSAHPHVTASTVDGVASLTSSVATLPLPVSMVRTGLGSYENILEGFYIDGKTETLRNLAAAINGDVGEGTRYGTGTTANPDAKAYAGVGPIGDGAVLPSSVGSLQHACYIEAIPSGTGGNSVSMGISITAGGFDWTHVQTGQAPIATLYAIKVDSNNIKLALSHSDAMSNTAIDITYGGSGLLSITK